MTTPTRRSRKPRTEAPVIEAEPVEEVKPEETEAVEESTQTEEAPRRRVRRSRGTE